MVHVSGIRPRTGREHQASGSEGEVCARVVLLVRVYYSTALERVNGKSWETRRDERTRWTDKISWDLNWAPSVFCKGWAPGRPSAFSLKPLAPLAPSSFPLLKPEPLTCHPGARR